MKRFNKTVKTGTNVRINGKWYKVSTIHESRQWIEVEGLTGSFQVGHVNKVTNKQK